jgi:hypothetical protein
MQAPSSTQNQVNGASDIELDDLLDPFGDDTELVDDNDEAAFFQTTPTPQRVDGLANLLGSLKCNS